MYAELTMEWEWRKFVSMAVFFFFSFRFKYQNERNHSHAFRWRSLNVQWPMGSEIYRNEKIPLSSLGFSRFLSFCASANIKKLFRIIFQLNYAIHTVIYHHLLLRLLMLLCIFCVVGSYIILFLYLLSLSFIFHFAGK